MCRGAHGERCHETHRIILLLELLEAIRGHPFLKERMALKGGTALNLFTSNVPRLSVDIDLNYIGAADRDGMLAALLSRAASRDVFDASRLLRVTGMDPAKLIPLLRGHETPRRGDLTEWTRALVSDRRELLSTVLPLANQEREFLAQLKDKGEILPEALTDDRQLLDIIRTHPGLLFLRGVRHHATSDSLPGIGVYGGMAVSVAVAAWVEAGTASARTSLPQVPPNPACPNLCLGGW